MALRDAGSTPGCRCPWPASPSGFPRPAPTSSLSFLAQVGKTSLIMALVGEEFPEEVRGVGAAGPPGWVLCPAAVA